MASSYSSNLKLELMSTGDQSGTWGNTTNTNLGTLLEQAIVGYTTQAITDGADTTITIANGASSVARNYVLQLTGALTANRNLIVPAIQKSYIIFNATTGGFAVTVKVSGQTGVTVANGKKAIVYNNGTDIIEVVNAPVTEAGTQTLTNKTLSTGTAITAGTINGASVGATTPSTGAFTTLSASSTVSGTGFSTYLASPPAIGGTTPAAGTFTTLGGTTITASVQFSGPHNGTVGATTPSTGAFTTLSASSTVSGAGFSTYLASPPAIGGTTPAAGSFTTLSASSTVSGTGFSTYLASPPAIGGTTPAAGSFTNLSATGTLTGSTGIMNIGSGQLYKDASGNVNIATTGKLQKLYVNGNAASSISAIGNTSGTITLDLSTANNFSLTLNANATNTLANPTNLEPGQSGVIYISQDATGSRTLAYGTSWDFSGGTAPTLTTTASAVDAIVYSVRSSTSILAQFIGDIK